MLPLEQQSFFRENTKPCKNLFHIEIVQQDGKSSEMNLKNSRIKGQK